MKIDRIVLDLDDTLNSCTMHILNRLGCGVGPQDYHLFPQECGYDIIGAWAKLCGRDKVDVPMFWEWVSRRTWESMPRSPQFWILDAAADLVGKENVLIATVPTKSADCHYAKYQWIDKQLPDWCLRQYSITPRKHKLSMPGVLLIDDCDHNMVDWREPGEGREGGQAILMPRPWNALADIGSSSGATSAYIAEELGKIET